MVPELRGPMGVAESAYPQNTGGAVMITASSEVPEAAMKFLDYAYSGYDAYALLRYGIEGKDFEWGTREPDFGIINTLDRLGTGRYQGEFVRGTSLSMTILVRQVRARVRQPGAGHDLRLHLRARGVQRRRHVRLRPRQGVRPAQRNRRLGQGAGRRCSARTSTALVEEETLKFILGTRPLSEYDQFLEDLDRIGLQRLNELLTEAYVAAGALN